jgi:predicted nucleotidyltransferase
MERKRKQQRLRRKGLNRKLDELLARVSIVNGNDELGYAVKTVVLFGSYLTDKERPGDLDVAIQLVMRHPEPSEKDFTDMVNRRVAASEGRRFLTFVDRLCWPQTEVLLFLKAHQRSFSFHEFDEFLLLNPRPFKVLFGDKHEVENSLRSYPRANLDAGLGTA